MARNQYGCRCGATFRTYAAEARHRHNFPALCRKAGLRRAKADQFVPGVPAVELPTPRTTFDRVEPGPNASDAGGLVMGTVEWNSTRYRK